MFCPTAPIGAFWDLIAKHTSQIQILAPFREKGCHRGIVKHDFLLAFVGNAPVPPCLVGRRGCRCRGSDAGRRGLVFGFWFLVFGFWFSSAVWQVTMSGPLPVLAPCGPHTTLS